MKKTGTEVVKKLIKLGVMASLSDIIDYDIRRRLWPLNSDLRLSTRSM
jgi:hypothetical protein